MKKLLLSLFMSVMACLGAVAQTTVTAQELSAAIGNAVTISGYTFDIEKNNGSTAPSLHAGTNAIRLYAKGSLKISGTKLTKIVIKLASDASYRYTSFEPSVGALNPAQAAGDTQIVWEGDATEVTFTVGDNATMGTDGETKAGQIRFASVEIYGEDSGETPVDPTPGPGEDPVDPQGGVTVTAQELSAAIGKAETISGYTFDIEKNNGSTAPSLHAGTNAIRLYAKGTLKISGTKLTKIVIKLASDASYRYTSFEPSVGALNPAQAAGDTQIVWEGDATEVTFTVGDNATMGTDGETKAGQIRFASVEIYGEGGGETPVDPTPGPGEDPVDPQGGITLTAEQLSAAIGVSANLSGYTFDIQKNNGSTAPQMNKTNLRIYAKGTMSVSGKKLTKIVVTLASDASYRYTTFEPSVGVLNPAQAAGDTEIVWEGDATEVTFTVGDNATMGTDGETKAGQIRLASVTIYGEPGEGGGDTPDVPTPDENLILSADFETDDCGFTFADNVFGDNKTVWTRDTYNGDSYMKATAYAGGANAVEGAYLVSPVMDLTNRNEIVLTFRHALGHAKTLEPAEMLSLWVREENMDWSVQLPIQAWPSYEGVSGNFTKFAEAGEYDLDQFKNKKIQIGWKYTSTADAAPTWKIDAVKVTGKIDNAISDIEADVNAPVEYFNLQGVRVANPENGLYIMRQGNKVTKVIR